MAFGKIGSGVAALGMLATANSAEAQDIKLASAEGLDNPAIVQIVENYRQCVEAATAKASSKETPKGREIVFKVKKKQCDRIRDAEMRIVNAEAGIAKAQQQIDLENQKQAALKAEQMAAEQRMAAYTAQLIADARNELGIK